MNVRGSPTDSLKSIYLNLINLCGLSEFCICIGGKSLDDNTIPKYELTLEFCLQRSLCYSKEFAITKNFGNPWKIEPRKIEISKINKADSNSGGKVNFRDDVIHYFGQNQNKANFHYLVRERGVRLTLGNLENFTLERSGLH